MPFQFYRPLFLKCYYPVTGRHTCAFFSGRDFIEEKLGSKYVVGRALDFAASFEESGPATPMFFILSPGVDPLKEVENQGETTSPWRPRLCQSASVSLHLSVSLFLIHGLGCTAWCLLTGHREIRVIAETTPGDHHHQKDGSGL